jgi:hypothetical protein
MSSQQIPVLVPVTPFTMTSQAAQAVWGQILKDVEFLEPDEAARFGVVLEELGYKPEYGFMTSEWDTLQVIAGRDPVMADHWSGRFGRTGE